MPTGVSETIAASMIIITLGDMLLRGFLILVGYKVVNVAGDYVHDKVIDDKTKREKDQKLYAAVEDICKEKGLSAEECYKYHQEADKANREDKADIFTKIASTLGLARSTVLWVIAAIIAFSLLRG